MINYTPEDLHDWEFKIIRAYTPAFKNPETIKQVVAEEAQAGWTLVEKFDDMRLRFKRKTSMRSNDSTLSINPYRSTYGVSQTWLILATLGAITIITFILIYGSLYF